MGTPSKLDGLTVSVRKTDAGDSYQFGVEVNGVYLPFGSWSAEDFDHRQEEAQKAKDAADLEAARNAPSAQDTPS